MTNEQKEQRMKELQALMSRLSMEDRRHGRVFIGSKRWMEIQQEYHKLYKELHESA